MTNLGMYAAELDQKMAETSMQKDLQQAQLAKQIPGGSRFVPTTSHVVAAALAIGTVVVAISGVVGI